MFASPFWFSQVAPLLLIAASFATAWADDWPQILGAKRDGHAAGEKLADAWPAEGPKPAWEADVGEGYSGPIVAAGKVYVFHREDDNEKLSAFDAITGKRLWDWSSPAKYREGVNSDRGPRATPVAVDGAIVVYGAAGLLAKINANTGAVMWSREVNDEYDAPDGYFGAGSTPLVLGDRVIVNVGGKGVSIVALKLADGDTLWEAGKDDAGYSAPNVMTIGGKERVVVISHTKVWSVDPATGEATVMTPYGRSGPRVNAAAPLDCEGRLFVTSSYGVGAILFDVKGAAPKKLWGDDRTLSSQYTTPVYDEGFLFGTHGREDQGAAEYRCVDAATGKTVWSKEGFSVAHTLAADGKLLVVETDGQARLLKLDATRHVELAKARLFDAATTRSVPALSGGKLFVKANGRRGGTIAAFEVGSSGK